MIAKFYKLKYKKKNRNEIEIRIENSLIITSLALAAIFLNIYKINPCYTMLFDRQNVAELYVILRGWI